MPSSIRVMLTGGIGAGKSTVARALTSRGLTVIDADRIGHSVLEPGGAAAQQVSELWPSVMVDGRVDRRALGAIVFGDRAELRRLEAVTHPAIGAEIARRVAAVEDPVVIVEIPLLDHFLGEGWRRVVVDAPDAVRVRRLLDRGMLPAEIDARMAAQPDRATWLAAADWVVANGGTEDQLAVEVERLVRHLGRVADGMPWGEAKPEGPNRG